MDLTSNGNDQVLHGSKNIMADQRNCLYGIFSGEQ